MSLDVFVQVEGRVPKLSTQLDVARANARVARQGLETMRQNFAHHNRSGETMRRLTSRITPTTVEWFDAAPQASFIEFGTKKHLIPVRTGTRALHLDDAGAGAPEFVKHVEHPGTRADPWMAPAVESNIYTFQRYYGEEVEADWNFQS